MVIVILEVATGRIAYINCDWKQGFVQKVITHKNKVMLSNSYVSTI